MFKSCLNYIRKCVFLIALLVHQSIDAQDIRGKVMDPDGNSLADVAVIGIPDSTFTSTNELGEFTIAKKEELLFRLLGYKSRQLYEFKDPSVIILQPDPIYLQGITVNTLAIPTRITEYPGSNAYITESEVQRDNPTLIYTLLNKQPGIYMHSGALNTNRITIRGIGSRSPFSTNKIRAYYDDIPLTNGTGETNIEDIDLLGVGNLEIIKGPNSSVYGSGLGGAIIINPVKGKLFQSQLSNDLTIGSYGLVKESLGFISRDEKQTIQLSGGTFHSDGYRENNKFDRKSIFTQYQRNFKKDQIRFLGYYTDQKAFIPSSIDSSTYASSPQSAAFTWKSAQGFEDFQSYLTGLSWNHLFKNDAILKSSIFHLGKSNYEPRPFNILKESTLTYGMRTKYVQDLNDQITFLAGTELFVDFYEQSTFENLYQNFPDQGSVQGARLSDLDEVRSNYNFFSQVDFKASDGWAISAGANLNLTRYDLTDQFNTDSLDQSGKYDFDPFISPRLAVSYRINPLNMVYGSLSYGFSPPSLEETLTPDGLINTSIKPEIGRNIELGVRGTIWRSRYLLSLYRMDIEDLLVTRRINQDQFFGINAGKTLHNGLEVNVFTRITDTPFLKLTHQIGYSLSNYTFEEFIDDGSDYSGNELTGVPQNVFNMGFDIDIYPFYSSLSFQYVDQIPITDDNRVYSDAYQVINGSIGFRKDFRDKWNIDVGYYVYNLLDEKYASMLLINATGFGNNAPRYFYPGLPRNHQIRLKISYSFKSN